jgi:4-hydroxy-4-methyl-2-oxoglutarate aldolase
MSDGSEMSASRRAVRTRFLAVDTSNVADALDERGLPHQGLRSDIGPLSGERLAGWAYTIEGESVAYSGSGDPAKMRACGEIGQDEVSVWAGGGEGICYFSEFPVFARYRTPIQSIGRWRVTGWQRPVRLPGATSRWVPVRPGDFVLADADGALIVPAEEVEPVLTRAEELTEVEARIRTALGEGSTLAECLERFGHV